MAARLADVIARMQTVLALATGLGHEVHDRVHALGGDEWAMVPRMPRLPAGLAPTLHAPTPHTLTARETI
jgi:hypothetical protein